ncbi:MAG: bifunctional demethylmenaquinone methyltransferase/2-methoxy-6-polyprenyl-1,4-benzoquinol methylase UbiE [Pseudomonadota bacterium]
MQKTPDKETFFGFKKVPFADKARMVGEVFSSVASKYDLMNDAMSLGVHRIWKRQFVDLVPSSAMRLLDVAGGTGDVAIRCHEKLHNAKSGTPEITICDINHEMLLEGRGKAVNHNILKNMYYVQGDAEDLPFPDNTFDCYTIAFGIRNVTNIDAALSESYRVLKPGGKFLCLEFSKVNSLIIEKFYDLYSMHIIPQIGRCIAGDRDAYQYLVESIRKFPDQHKFTSLIEGVGYQAVRHTNLTFGVAAIHVAYKKC